MTTVPKWRLALSEFANEVRRLYGSQLENVILYGSRARNGEEESDIDTLVILHSRGDFWREFDRISPIASRVSLDYDVVISAIPVGVEELRNARNPLLANVRREGVPVT